MTREPTSRYQMFYMGAMRPVTWMGNHHVKAQTFLVERADLATLWISEKKGFVAVSVAPGDITDTFLERDGKQWLTID